MPEPAIVLELNEALAERDRLRRELDATYDDVMVLLDQHVSAEVAKEARHRLIERMAAGPEEGEA